MHVIAQVFVCLSRQDFAAVKRKKKWQPFSDKRSFFFLGPFLLKNGKFQIFALPPAIAVSFARFRGLNAFSWTVAGSWICRKLLFVISFMELLLLRRLRYPFALFNKNLLLWTSMELTLIYGCLLQVRVTVMEESWLNVSWSCRPPKLCVLCVSSCGKGWWNGIWTRCPASVLQGYLPTYFWVLCRPVLKRQQAAESP